MITTNWVPPRSIFLSELRGGGGYPTGISNGHWDAQGAPGAVEYIRVPAARQITILPAPGALLGEHYITLDGERLGTTQPGVNGWRTNLYSRFMYKPDELLAIAVAVANFAHEKEQ